MEVLPKFQEMFTVKHKEWKNLKKITNSTTEGSSSRLGKMIFLSVNVDFTMQIQTKKITIDDNQNLHIGKVTKCCLRTY